MKETEIDVVFHDPKGFLKDAVIHYFWFINTVNYGQTPTVRYWISQCSGCLKILHLPGPLWIQLHKSWGLWCGSDSDCIFQCRLGQSYHKTFCLFASNYFRSKLSSFHAEPNSTLEQASLNTVSRDMGSELSLREVRHFLSPFEHHLHTHFDFLLSARYFQQDTLMKLLTKHHHLCINIAFSGVWWWMRLRSWGWRSGDA